MEPEGLTIEQYRGFYAEEIRAVTGVESAELISAFARVPREKFLGPPPWKIGMDSSGYRTVDQVRDLYHNVVVALKSEQALNNGQPSALASWIAALNLTPGAHIFHVGCGSGYYTAIMAEVLGANGSIVAAEFEDDLAKAAAENLAEYPRISVIHGDGAVIDPGQCDAILINAGVTHPHLPWLHRLKDGGRIVLPITVELKSGVGSGVMVRITRERDRYPAKIVSAVGIYSSVSVRDPAIEVLLNKAFASRAILKLKSVRLDAHEEGPDCIVHSPENCLSEIAVEQSAAQQP